MQRYWLVWLSSLTCLIHGLAFSSSMDDVHTVLKDLRGVEVFVSDMNDSLRSVELSKEHVHTEAMRRIRSAGIRILTADEAPGTLGLPILYVHVKTAKHAANVYAYYIDVSLREIVRLERNDRIFIDAPSWSESELGLLDHKELKQIRDRIRYYVDKFIVTYQLANPQLLEPVTDAFPAHLSFEGRIRQVQHRLKEAGFAPGPLDGQFGPMTKRALRQFQLANKIPTTGHLDEATQKALGIHMMPSSSSTR